MQRSGDFHKFAPGFRHSGSSQKQSLNLNQYHIEEDKIEIDEIPREFASRPAVVSCESPRPLWVIDGEADNELDRPSFREPQRRFLGGKPNTVGRSRGLVLVKRLLLG